MKLAILCGVHVSVAPSRKFCGFHSSQIERPHLIHLVLPRHVIRRKKVETLLLKLISGSLPISMGNGIPERSSQYQPTQQMLVAWNWFDAWCRAMCNDMEMTWSYGSVCYDYSFDLLKPIDVLSKVSSRTKELIDFSSERLWFLVSLIDLFFMLD